MLSGTRTLLWAGTPIYACRVLLEGLIGNRSMAHRRLYLAAYDITDPQRLNRIARYLSKRAVRVQYSVFAADLKRAALDDTIDGLNDLIDRRSDDVRIYPLPRSGEVALMGRQIFPEDILLLQNGYNMLRLNTVPLTDGEEA